MSLTSSFNYIQEPNPRSSSSIFHYHTITMSATRNTESLYNQGEFRSRVPPAEPLTTGGHKPGVKVGNDAAPEFHAEKYPPGTAPPESTFLPNPVNEFPAKSPLIPPADTLGGTTSQALYTGLGKPFQGQVSTEVRGSLLGEEMKKRKKEHAGLEGVGASEGGDIARDKWVRQKGADLPEGVEKGTRGKANPEYPGAEDRLPTGAEQVAADAAQR
ncbi:hypothetical protein F5Y00DRAFT_249119 [Daldinia vernicosa]|uniref:uncharacterized protein n=1 Tax=Daldinia vernicosa TaxID=114800 RepID=UPI0020086CBA|nr:uncharacterized protein F5Y00DRAFT_249119 [Daldinia vernicosa]KAI0844277.1 hypothetical protein F5Y00DRAFT_249119 [Daldinia vernicosa]